MTSRKVVEKITTRVFCNGARGGSGGNPVTVFASQSPLAASVQRGLALQCENESVMVVASTTTDTTNHVPQMACYLPSGEATRFSPHAAMGGAFALAASGRSTDISSLPFQCDLTGDKDTVHILDMDETKRMGMTRVNMETSFEEEAVSHSPSLQRVLRGHLNINSEHLRPQGRRFPSFRIGSIGGGLSKTALVHINSLQRLSQAKAPKSISSSSAASNEESATPQRNSFETACSSIDGATGLMLYANRDDNEKGAWECRYFPRVSPPSEEHATGMAAAALAGTLFSQGIYLPLYKFYQGATTGKPSIVEVVNFRLLGSTASFGLQGMVEIDSLEVVEVDEDK